MKGGTILNLLLTPNCTAIHFAELTMKDKTIYRYTGVFYIRLLNGNRIGFYDQDDMPLKENNGQLISEIAIFETSKSFFTFDINLLNSLNENNVYLENPASFELTFDERLAHGKSSTVAYSNIGGNSCIFSGIKNIEYSKLDNHIYLVTDSKKISLALNEIKQLALPESILTFDAEILTSLASKIIEPKKKLKIGEINIDLESGN